MTEFVDVAVALALLDRAQTFANNEGLTISLPNLEFTPPTVGKAAKYLRASLLPADTATLGISDISTNKNYGFLQMDVFYGAGGGEIAPRRIAADIVNYFKRGTKMISNGFNISVLEIPKLGPQMRKDAWVMLPVRIPYTCFAIPA